MTSKIIRADGVTELTGIKSVTFHETANADIDLRPGCVASSFIEVECYGEQTDAPSSGEELTYYQVVGLNQTLIGKFYATPSIPTKATYRFTAYDSASLLDADFSAWLSANQSNFPMTVYALVSAACSAAGVTLASSSWAMSTMNVNAFYADSITCRDILSYAAEIACCFVRCNTSGEIEFSWYSTVNNKRIYPSSGVSGSETRYAYKQSGLDYANYDTSALARVSVHPVGEEDVAYIYPTGVSSGNTLAIKNNALLYGASSADMNSIAQNVYTVLTTLGSYRPTTAKLFPNENPFRAGDVVAVTDAQGISFTTIIMSMTVSASEATVVSTGHEVYGEYALDTAKSLIQLAADIVRINKLKVGWAEIDQIFANDITVTGQLHSTDYAYTSGEFADSGMGMDFGTKRFNTPNFGITPDGDVYAQGGRIAGFNIHNSIYEEVYPTAVSSFTGTSYTYTDGLLTVTGSGNATFQAMPTTRTINGVSYPLTKIYYQPMYLTGGGTTQFTVSYEGSGQSVSIGRTVVYLPTNTDQFYTVIPPKSLLSQSDNVVLQAQLLTGRSCKFILQYGNYYSLYTEHPTLGGEDGNVYVGDDGISVGDKIIFNPDGSASVNSLIVNVTDAVPTLNSTRLMTSGDIYNSLYEVTHITSISSIATESSDCTITSADYYQVGKLAMVKLIIKKTTAITSTSTTVLATMAQGKRPITMANANMGGNLNPVRAYIQDTGSVAVYGTISANQSITIVSTYIVA